MKTYDTLTEALADLQQRGYKEDFNLHEHCLYCAADELEIHPEDFVVDEFYRFEGETDPGDSMVLYAISANTGQKKGTLVDAYGVYADNLTPAMVEKLHIKGR
jgi:hypothetical protein